MLVNFFSYKLNLKVVAVMLLLVMGAWLLGTYFQVRAAYYMEEECTGNAEICDVAISLFEEDEGCSSYAIPGDGFIPYCFHYNVNSVTYYCSYEYRQMYSGTSLRDILNRDTFNYAQEAEGCNALLSFRGYSSEYNADTLAVHANFAESAPNEQCSGTNSLLVTVPQATIREGSIVVNVTGCIVDPEAVEQSLTLAYTVENLTGAGFAGTGTVESGIVVSANGTFSGSITINGDSIAYSERVVIRLPDFTDVNSGSFSMQNNEPPPVDPEPEPEPQEPTLPGGYNYSTEQFGAIRCPFARYSSVSNPSTESQYLTEEDARARKQDEEPVFVVPDLGLNADQLLEFGQCVECINAGATWTGGLGCIATDIQGLFNSVIRLVLGVMGGVALIRLIILGYRYQFEDKDDLKPTVQDILATLGGLLLVLFSVVLLRFIGVNLLDIVPPGFFG